MFEENDISDTVVEFRVVGKSALSQKNVIFGSLMLIILLWSLVVSAVPTVSFLDRLKCAICLSRFKHMQFV